MGTDEIFRQLKRASVNPFEVMSWALEDLEEKMVKLDAEIEYQHGHRENGLLVGLLQAKAILEGRE